MNPILIAKGIDTIIGIARDLIDGKITRDQASDRIREARDAIDGEVKRGQVEINKLEAVHTSLFVAGWRPFVGWVSGAGFAYQFLVHPFLTWLSANAGWIAPPTLDTDTMLTMLGALLGLAGYRTFERVTGKIPNGKA